LKNCSRDTAAKILGGGAQLYGFTEADFEKAAKASRSTERVQDEGRLQGSTAEKLEISIVA
jgi:hypothetical protein